MMGRKPSRRYVAAGILKVCRVSEVGDLLDEVRTFDSKDT